MNTLVFLAMLACFLPSCAWAEVGKASSSPSIQYFQYWVKYGEKAQHPGKTYSFELMQGRMNVFGIASGKDFCGPVDEAVPEELASLLSHLDLTNWEGEQPGKDPYDLLKKSGGKGCVWSLTVVFKKNSDGEAPERIRISGMDEGNSAGRRKADEALVQFFKVQSEKALRVSERQIESLRYVVGAGKQGVLYLLSTEEGKVLLNRSLPGRETAEYVSPDLPAKLEDKIRHHNLDAWHDFRGVADSSQSAPFSLWIRYNTCQEIRAGGYIGKAEGVPQNFAEADVDLRWLMDSALGGEHPAEGGDEGLGNIREFSFRLNGMANDAPCYEIYRRRDADGPHMILRRKIGGDDSAEEAVLCLADVDMLEKVFRRQFSEWNGFRRYARDVLDGGGFSLAVRFKDGSSIMADGQNIYPPGFRERKEELFLYLDGLLEKKKDMK